MIKMYNPVWKTKAAFTVETKNFRIHQCRLVLAETGRLVAMMPYRTYQAHGRKNYEPIIEIVSVDYLEAVTSAAVEKSVELWGEDWWK